MHIVYVSRELVPSRRCGGIGGYVWDIARHVVRSGHRVTVICASDDTRQADDSVADGVRVIRLPGGDFAVEGIEGGGRLPLKGYVRMTTRFRSYRRRITDCLEALIDTYGVDIVEFAEYGNEAAEWLKQPRRAPMVVRCHGPGSRKGGRRITWRPWRWLKHRRACREYDAVRSAEAVTAPSAAMAELIRIDGELAGRKIHIIPNPVEAAFWASENPGNNWARGKGLCVVFSASSVVHAKGHGELVEAVRLLREAGRDVRLVIAGKWGKLGRSLAQRLRASPELSSWFTLPGHVGREHLQGHYRNASVVCFPSWWENCPCACLEAMASGGLVVGSSAGGMTEIIRDGVDGLLVAPRDPALLAASLARALDMPHEEQAAMRTNAQQRIRSSFDVDVLVPRTLQFYADVAQDWAQRNHKEDADAGRVAH